MKKTSASNIAYKIKPLHKKMTSDETKRNIMFESKSLDLDFWNKILALLLTNHDLGKFLNLSCLCFLICKMGIVLCIPLFF